MKFLVFCVFFVVGSFALYEYQAGVYDWSLRNIGEIDTLLMENEHTAYLTLKDGDNWIGSIFLETGF